MRRIYTFVYYLLLPFIILRLILKSRKAPAYRQRMLERLAYFSEPKQKGVIWIHAVSLGEVIAAIPLIRELMKQYPNINITVTTMTPTGSERVLSAFGDKIFHVYLPYDVPCIIQRFIEKTNPKVLVIMETELWPNLLYVSQKNQIPIILANARLSERSAKNYGRIRNLTKEMLNRFSHIAVQTKEEAQRYLSLGLPENKITVTGSIKFDLYIPPDLDDKASGLKRLLGENRPAWIAASTHAGEEAFILQAHQEVLKTIPSALLIWVPRHLERFQEVSEACQKANLQVVLRSENHICEKETNVFIGDTMGELLLFYACSDVAFVGGSFIPIGGHNLLEPAALAKPAITGPHMHNFVEITRLLKEADAIIQIQEPDQLAERIIALLQDTDRRREMGNHGKHVVEKNRGALAKHLEIISKVVGWAKERSDVPTNN